MKIPAGWRRVDEYHIECGMYRVCKMLCLGAAAYAAFRKADPNRPWNQQPEFSKRISDWLASPEAAVDAALADQLHRETA